MHDVSAPGWRQTLDRHHTALTDDLAAQFAAEIATAVQSERERCEQEFHAERQRERAEHTAALEAADEQSHRAQDAERAAHEHLQRATDDLARRFADERKGAEDASRRKLAESLNQTLRRIRQTTAEHETLQLLLEATAPSADRAVVLLIENNHARVAASRGAAFGNDASRGAAFGNDASRGAAFANNVSSEPEHHDEEPGDEKFSAGSIALGEAPAIASCVESRDPVIAMLASGEISSLLAAALSGTGADKTYLFPVTVRQSTVALMIACGNVTPAPIELLCEAAGMKLETFETIDMSPAPAVAAAFPSADQKQPLVQIASPAGSGKESAVLRAESAATTWSKLTPEQQALHLRAQRNARVRVAQIRISESDALRAGVQAGNIYNAVRQSIDAARDEFQQAFMLQSPTMVDYLHLEIMRSLAHDDSRLLGPDYPGPLV